jgi:DNA-binding MarR family transcriptional regulator
VSGDFDPRDVDSREQGDGVHDRKDQYLSLGRGSGALAKAADDDASGRDGASRERDREARDRHNDRGHDLRDVFVRGLDLPHGHDRELVRGRDRDRDYTLSGLESRTVATLGAFRVVSERDLRDSRDEAAHLRHLQDQGLIQRVPLNERERAITLTQDGRELLEHHRAGHSDRQTFYADADRARERTRDTHVYRAYLKAAERLQARGAGILRVELDRELKRASSGSCRSATAANATATDGPTAPRKRSRTGHATTGCRTSTGTSIFPMCASSTRT